MAQSPFTAQFVELFRISGHLAQEIADELALTRTQMVVLHRIWEIEGCTMSDLKRDLDVTTGAITGLIDRLEGQGLVARVPSQEDRRVVFLKLTDAGDQAVEAIRTAWDHKLLAWLDRVPAGEREAIKTAIARMVEASPAPDCDPKSKR